MRKMINCSPLGMKNKKHIIDCLRGKNPFRDLILVEKRIPCAYSVPNGTEYSADILSLTGHPIWWMIRLFTNILSLTGLSKPLQVDYFTSLRESQTGYMNGAALAAGNVLRTIDEMDNWLRRTLFRILLIWKLSEAISPKVILTDYLNS